MVSYCELNALCPMFRTYVKDDKRIIIGFGLRTLNKDGSTKREVQFYFHVDTTEHFFQLTNDLSKFEDAINGRLEVVF